MSTKFMWIKVKNKWGLGISVLSFLLCKSVPEQKGKYIQIVQVNLGEYLHILYMDELSSCI